MKTAKLGATIVLLLFVVATVGMLIAQEVSQLGAEPAAGNGPPGPAAAPESTSGESIPEASSAVDPVSTVGAANDEGPGTEATEGEPPVSTVEVVAEAPCVIDVIYFHNTFRCATCLKIERDAKAAIEVEFPDQLAGGRLRWSAVNMEEQRQYVEQYDLVKPTLILARSVGDEPRDWVALDETWTLVRYEARFSLYIGDSVRAFLVGCP